MLLCEEVSEAILACPDCLTELTRNQASYLCDTCRIDYPFRGGVFRHTAFQAIAPLVCQNGTPHIMVYEQQSPLKVAGIEFLRMVLRRLPPEFRYGFCRHSVIKSPLFFQLQYGCIV